MKIKTSELSGAALDWAVATAEKVHGKWARTKNEGQAALLFAMHDGALLIFDVKEHDYVPYNPSADWSQGGLIIERERITLRPHQRDANWSAFKTFIGSGRDGPTPLIAAMRCFVASKLGDEVNIPEELL